MEYGPKIGVDKAYVAALTAGSDVVGGTATWGAPALLAGGLVKAAANINGALVTDWGENGQFAVMNSRGNLQIALEVQDIDPAILAALLGQTRANGITAESPLDQSPYYALGFRVWIEGVDSGSVDSSGRIYEYFWFLKLKFALANQGAEGKKQTTTPQHVQLVAEGAYLQSNGLLEVHERTNTADAVSATIAAWFTAVVSSSSIDLGAVTESVIAGSTSGKTITITFGKSGGGSFAIVHPTDDTQVTVSVVSTGLLLAGAYTYTQSVAGVAPTLTIANPNIAGVSYLVAINHLKDTNGVYVTPKTVLVTPA